MTPTIKRKIDFVSIEELVDDIAKTGLKCVKTGNYSGFDFYEFHRPRKFGGIRAFEQGALPRIREIFETTLGSYLTAKEKIYEDRINDIIELAARAYVAVCENPKRFKEFLGGFAVTTHDFPTDEEYQKWRSDV